MILYRVIEKFRSFTKPINTYIKASSSEYAEQLAPENVLKHDYNMFHSINKNGSFIQLDFIKYNIYIEFVKIQISINQDPTNWVLEASTDGNTFSTIYENKGFKFCESFQQRNDNYNNCYCTYYANRTFEVKKGIYKSLKLTLTGHSSCAFEYLLILTEIEIIGKIMMGNFGSCSINRTSRAYIFMFIFLISS